MFLLLQYLLHLRIHGSVEDTKSSTNKQHTLSHVRVWGGGEQLRTYATRDYETTSRGLCGLVCPSHTSERGGEAPEINQGWGCHRCSCRAAVASIACNLAHPGRVREYVYVCCVQPLGLHSWRTRTWRTPGCFPGVRHA